MVNKDICARKGCNKAIPSKKLTKWWGKGRPAEYCSSECQIKNNTDKWNKKKKDFREALKGYKIDGVNAEDIRKEVIEMVKQRRIEKQEERKKRMRSPTATCSFNPLAEYNIFYNNSIYKNNKKSWSELEIREIIRDELKRIKEKM